MADEAERRPRAECAACLALLDIEPKQLLYQSGDSIGDYLTGNDDKIAVASAIEGLVREKLVERGTPLASKRPLKLSEVARGRMITKTDGETLANRIRAALEANPDGLTMRNGPFVELAEHLRKDEPVNGAL